MASLSRDSAVAATATTALVAIWRLSLQLNTALVAIREIHGFDSLVYAAGSVIIALLARSRSLTSHIYNLKFAPSKLPCAHRHPNLLR